MWVIVRQPILLTPYLLCHRAGAESAIPIRAVEICWEGTHAIPNLFWQVLKGKRYDKGG